MEIELSERLGRKVDLRTPRELSKHVRDKVFAGAAVQHERPWSDRPTRHAGRSAGGYEVRSRPEFKRLGKRPKACAGNLCKSWQVIGEAAGKVSPEIARSAPEIPWPKIVRMRNRLIMATVRSPPRWFRRLFPEACRRSWRTWKKCWAREGAARNAIIKVDPGARFNEVHRHRNAPCGHP